MSDMNIYLGDGAYVELTYGQVRLFTSNGIEVTNEIFLEAGMMDRLVEWWKTVVAEVGE